MATGFKFEMSSKRTIGGSLRTFLKSHTFLEALSKEHPDIFEFRKFFGIQIGGPKSSDVFITLAGRDGLHLTFSRSDLTKGQFHLTKRTSKGESHLSLSFGLEPPYRISEVEKSWASIPLLPFFQTILETGLGAEAALLNFLKEAESFSFS